MGEQDGGAMKPHIIVCGLGQTGYRVFSLLKRQGAAVVGVSDVPLAHRPLAKVF